MDKKTILITGGLGYIGSHAVVAFEEAGYRTIIVDNLSGSSLATLDGIISILGYRPIFYQTDIDDIKEVSRIFREHSIDAVIHFAGFKIPKESCFNPFGYYENNVTKTLSLLSTMEKFNVRKIIFSSSAAVYHTDNVSPIDENGKLGAEHPYAGTKFTCERILEDLARHDGFSVIALRYFNPIGAHPSGKIGETPSGVPANIFPYIMDVAKGLRDKLFIYGDDYPTRDGTGVRDYIDVNDLVDAHLCAYKKLDHDPSGSYRVFNIGTGKGTSVRELINTFEKETGVSVPFVVAPRRIGDLAEVYASAEKARKILGWQAKRQISDSVRTGWLFRQQRDSNSLLSSMSSDYRILQVIPYFPPHRGGLETVAEEIAKNLTGYRFAKVLNITFGVGQKKYAYEKDGYQVLVIPAFEMVHNFPFPKFWHPIFWKVLGQAREFKADIIQTHTRFFLSTFLGGILSKIWNIPWVHIEHGSGFVVSSRGLIAGAAYLYDQTLGRWSIRSADSVVVISQACARFVQEKLQGKKTTVIYRGFDLIVDPWSPIDPNLPVRLTFVGRLVSLKAVDVLIMALSELKNTHQFTLTIAGDGDERQNLENMTKKLNLSDRITFVGYQDRDHIAHSILPNTDILINPSLQEGLPTTVIEGLVANCVVVATDVGGTTEISPGEDLIIAEPGNISDLKEKLQFALENHTELHGLSRDEVLEKFDAHESMRRFVAVYREVLNK